MLSAVSDTHWGLGVCPLWVRCGSGYIYTREISTLQSAPQTPHSGWLVSVPQYFMDVSPKKRNWVQRQVGPHKICPMAVAGSNLRVLCNSCQRHYRATG